jgi:hypothetical protein
MKKIISSILVLTLVVLLTAPAVKAFAEEATTTGNEVILEEGNVPEATEDDQVVLGVETDATEEQVVEDVQDETVEAVEVSDVTDLEEVPANNNLPYIIGGVIAIAVIGGAVFVIRKRDAK